MTHSVKARLAAVFAAATLVLGVGSVVNSASAQSAKSKYHKSQKIKNKQKAKNSVKNGDNSATSSGGTARCLIFGGSTVTNGACSADGGGPAVAGNINVPIAVNVATNTNSADDDDNNGQVGAMG